VIRTPTSLITLAVVLGALHQAAADPATADQLARQASEAANAGQFAVAAEKYSAAYKADPSRPALFCNVGISYFKGQDLPRAHLLLGLCLERAQLDPAFVSSVRTVLASIETTMRAGGHEPITFAPDPDTATLSLDELGPDATFSKRRTVWLKLGTYHLRAHAEGHDDREVTVTASSVEPRTVEVRLERHVVEPLPNPNPNPSPSPNPTPAPPPPVETRSKLLPIAATAGTVIAGGVAVVAWATGFARAKRAKFALGDDVLDADRSAVSTANTVFAISGAVALAGAGVSAYLWYRVLHTPSTRVEVAPTSGGATVSLSGRF